MKLNLEQFKSIAFGATEIINEDGAFVVKKLLQNQIEALKNYRNGDLLHGGENSTGCCLDFHTDSDYFKFTPTEGSRFEVYINNVFTSCFLKPQNGWAEIEVALPEGENRVTLVMPSHASYAKFISVELSDNAKFTPHNYKLKMAFFGDSITQGWDATYDSLSYAWQVARFFDAEMWNTGVGGNVFLPDFAGKREDFEPDVVIIAYGTNDFATRPSLESVKENSAEFLKRMKQLYSKSKIFVLLPIWRGDLENWNNPMGTFEDCRMTIKETAQELSLNVIDAYGFVPPMEEFFADKVLHPNATGFGIYAQNLIKVLSDKI